MRCNICKAKFSEIIFYSWVKYFCSEECKQEFLWEISEKKIFSEKKVYKINSVSKTNKNTPAKFSQETKEKIIERDQGCIICWSKFNIEYHHAYFGGQAMRKENRNEADQGVALCNHHHHEIHHWNNWEWQNIRKECIYYLVNLIK